MPYDGKIMARARSALSRRREENELKLQRRTEQVYALVPEIRQLDRQLTRQMAELARLVLSRDADRDEKLHTLEERNLDLQMRRAELLVEHGYPTTYLDEIVSCPKCGDRGQVDGAVCDCLIKLYNRELTEELGTLLKTGDECFERFDLTLYDDAPLVPGGIVPRQAMQLVYDTCLRFAESFPDGSENLLFQGGTGLGKTFLSACIARKVADRGFSVCYDSASAALDAFEQQKFARDPAEAESAGARVRRMLDCDLMLLDDLGTEMSTAFSMSALYTLINTRLTHGRQTVISTNLTDEELARRYTPQIVSRLAGEYLHLPFVGRDIRRLRR